MDLLTKALQVFKKEGVVSLIKKSAIYILWQIVNVPLIGYIRITLCKHKIKKFLGKIHGLDDALHFTFSFKFLGIHIKPAQVKDEIKELSCQLQKRRLETILEIGTENGGTLFLFSHTASPNATLISIDLPGGPFGGGYPRWKIPLYKSFAKKSQRLYLIRADSHDPKTLAEVKAILGDKKLDFLFIDGDHTFEGIKMDFEMYSPLVRRRGPIAFYDIVEHPPETVCEVSRFWNEIKHNYKYTEIVKDWNQKWAGIGVLYV